ncbi:MULTISPECIES: tRNA (N6-isopentenyl adenosine(37)-C2)-methylthiotransferase MiaB [Clostridium]|jgi:tRNA-2-methylthio-N6-dimethylallyladenosine synthase|uniref:tRNA (N6-isopentenyl adenosine(37)-C2)-methylthiotransferase MiaB n=1 Tax=Clostridium TaxID=1485 RepID=UPI00019B01B2|nr:MULTISPECIES: tRNA (N6-isopentenyl adenosine(37)-C2)-methylthiotransferase MiaB [Clostridium]EEH97865.1 (Dimethylallyl)adenosine tRNA methylthiotransferase miaB [Clostridium sp. 7_2_43FAA]MBS5307031.1 tRNA (N6-isopentenyl adenosine(37)-C2)-methylthiotransferase MiaB [Clostridium sp.]MBU6135401.1 tRNA (N6-isopentenyl adenosine(37)-C2)-methylthiotransferase MiaB [Clostridium tertium]MDB1941028.1 tRNA (N6-isopentenyl adenosine(37)-C2)-methylthiotransferase MiaB [Clostridium tertium]MDB1944936.
MKEEIKELKYYIETWGCQMNEEDSEKLSGMLKSVGYTKTESIEEAGIIIYNTCCVRENAENKVFGNLGELKHLKKKNPDLIIAVCGCMMQQEGMADKILKKFPHVNIIFGTHNAYKFPEYLNRVKTEGVQVKEIFNKESEIVEGLPIDRESDVKAFVTIMYGCNNFCTYCVVPYVRGRERSRKSEDIINEIKDLVSKGYKEITLLGQNVNSYGKGLEEDIDFAKLLRKINEVDGLERVRFMTSHPKDLNKDVILAIKECDKLCEQIHLPVQSGSDRILKKMNRHYTKEYYLELVDMIKREIPDVSLTTDIIVGFPGETEEDFLDTLDLVERVGYDSAFTFIYSRRNNTPADMMLNQVPDADKHHRFDRLIKVVNEGVIKSNKVYEGKTVEVLVEGPSKNDATKLTGRTRNGKLVNFSGENVKAGDLVNVKIVRAQPFSLVGEVK